MRIKICSHLDVNKNWNKLGLNRLLLVVFAVLVCLEYREKTNQVSLLVTFPVDSSLNFNSLS